MTVKCYYRVFGLSLASDHSLAGLLPESFIQAADVELCVGSLPSWLDDGCGSTAEADYVSAEVDGTGAPAVCLWKLSDGLALRLRFSDGVEFVVDRAGGKVWSIWPQTMCVADMATYLLGPVMGLLLRLRGIVCLHASAIAVGARAIAFVGAAGAGKSTIAAAFAKLGFPVLTDDVVTLVKSGEDYLVAPGEPRLRLWPDSVAALYGAPDVLPRLTPGWEKRYLDLQEDGYRYQEQALALAGIYVLDNRSETDAPAIAALPLREQLMALIANSYANKLLDSSMRAHEFELFGQLIERVSINRLRPNSAPDKLVELCRLVLDDLRVSRPRGHVGAKPSDSVHV